MGVESNERTLAEPLNEREIEILGAIADGLSNREIAHELYLSVDTIKWYNKGIFQKLDVNSRTQAAARARELGLLEDDPGVNAPQHNLPAQVTRLVGREREIEQVERLLSDSRLVTLTGPGGVGKTRLALAVAAQQTDSFRDGVFFVSLAPLSSPRSIVQAVVEAMGQSFLTSGDLKSHLLYYLRNKKMLLLMDNFEHLLSGISVLREIVEAAPGVRILATSREKLKLHGEMIFVTQGLSYPSIKPLEAGDIEYSSIQLFLERARQLRPDFEPTEDDVSHITHICQMVQGLPLAVELAAAWFDTLSCAEIAAEIDRSLDVLAADLRDVPPRQQSIRAVFDYSWMLTPEAERDVFLKLSIFRGGFTRKAAERVADATLPELASLVGKSLLRWEPDTKRYQMHELLQQYTRERLEQRPEVIGLVYRTHAAYYADFMHDRSVFLRDSRQIEALEDIEAELGNIRGAWRYWVDQANASQMGKFLTAFYTAYFVRGWLHAGEEVNRQAVEALQDAALADEEAAVVRAVALAYRAFFLAPLGQAEQGYDLAKESVAILEGLSRPVDLAIAWINLRWVAYYLARRGEEEEAERRIYQIARDLDDRSLLAYSLFLTGMNAYRQQEYEEARRFGKASLEWLEESGDRIRSALPLLLLGHVSFALGEDAQAGEYYQRCLNTATELGFRWAAVNATKYLGQVALSQGEIGKARAHTLQGLRVAEQIGLEREILNLLYDLARVRVAEGEPERAVEFLGLVLGHPASYEGRMGGGRIRDSVQALLADLETEFPPQDYAIALERGNSRNVDEVVDEILSGERPSTENLA